MLLHREETYDIIGKCMEIHRELGHGFLEVVYKDALEYLFRMGKVQFEREKEYTVNFRNVQLPHKFYADFVVFDKIILEIKCSSAISNAHIAQTLNYLKVSNNNIGLLINFGKEKLEYKRLACNIW